MSLARLLRQVVSSRSSFRRRTASQARRFRSEICERRLVPAGNVTAVFDGANLTLTGDSGGNLFEVSVEGGQVVVNGVRGTTINGSNAPFVVTAGTTLAGSLVIRGENGNDTIVVRDVTVNGSITIDGGSGKDRIGLQDVTAVGDVNVTAGNGTDETLLQNVQALNVVVDDQNGKSTVVLDNVTATNVTVSTGNGSDRVFLNDVAATGLLDFDTGNGKDLVAVLGSSAASLTGDTGNGPDVVVLDLDTTNPAGSTVVDLGAGPDALVVQGGDFQTAAQFNGGGSKNVLFIDPSVTHPNGLTPSNFETTVTSLSELPPKLVDTIFQLDDDLADLINLLNGLP